MNQIQVINPVASDARVVGAYFAVLFAVILLAFSALASDASKPIPPTHHADCLTCPPVRYPF